jgi:hemin uptake protein HemP
MVGVQEFLHFKLRFLPFLWNAQSVFRFVHLAKLMSSDRDQHVEPEPEKAAASLPPESLCYAFDQLAKGATVVEITFDGQVYQLRKTRNGRLILTK